MCWRLFRDRSRRGLVGALGADLVRLLRALRAGEVGVDDVIADAVDGGRGLRAAAQRRHAERAALRGLAGADALVAAVDQAIQDAIAGAGLSRAPRYFRRLA
jgi:hypothetical protein